MEELLQVLQPTLITLTTLILGYLGTRVKVLIDSKIAIDKQNEVMNIISASVLWVEQITKDKDFVGNKFDLAKNRAKGIINNLGLEITEEELEMWIEAFVHELHGGI